MILTAGTAAGEPAPDMAVGQAPPGTVDAGPSAGAVATGPSPGVVARCLGCHIARDGRLDIVGVHEIEALPRDWQMFYEDPLDRDGDGIAGRVSVVSGGGRPLMAKWGERLAAARFDDFARIAGDAHDIDLSDPRGLSDIRAAFEALSPTPVSPFANEAQRRDFERRGCVRCHVTDSYMVDGQTITPLSDFLLHDMGEGPRRTAPLWTCATCAAPDLADPHGPTGPHDRP